MAARFWVGGTGTWDASDTTHWAATSGGAGGQSVPDSVDDVTFDASSGGGTVTVAYDMNVQSVTMGAFLNGTLNFVTFSPTMRTFAATGTVTRTLNMGSGTWTLTGNNGTVISIGTVTGLTFSGSAATVNMTYSGGTGTRTFNFGLVVPATSVGRVNIIAGTDVVQFGTSRMGNLDFTGFSGTWQGTSAIDVMGFLTLSSTLTRTATCNITFSGTAGPYAITSNGIALDSAIIFAGATATGTYRLADNFVTGPTRTLTLTNGTFNANGFDVTAGRFNSSNSNVRTTLMGSGTWTLTSTGAVWDTGSTGSNLTLASGTSTIVINDSSSASKTFAASNNAIGNAGVFYNLKLSGTGTGIFIIGGGTGGSGRSYNNITVENAPHTVQFFAGNSITANSLTWSGTPGNLNTFQSTTPGSAWTISVPSGIVSQNYISLRDSTATGGAIFYAGNHSVDVSGNTGWIFLNPPLTISEDAGRDQNHVPSILGSDSTDPTKTVKMYADPTTHALSVNDDTTGTDQGGSIAPRDANHVPALLAVSRLDGVTPVVVYADSTTHELLITSS